MSTINALITGYYMGSITEEEASTMIDLTNNEITTVTDKEDQHDYEYYDSVARTRIEVPCSAELDNEWANESI